MTIQEALDRIDTVKPNMLPADIKITWLSELDGMIQQEIISMHAAQEDAVPKPDGTYAVPRYDPLSDSSRPLPPEKPASEGTKAFTGYDSLTDTSTGLLAVFPYDKLYQFYLAMQIDIATGEIEKYNNDSQLFNAAYQEYSDWYTRHHYPLPRRREFRL